MPLTIYGQEKDIVTRGLAVMNMILHGKETAEIAQGDVLAEPEFMAADGKLRTFDFVVANPPFSDKSWATGFTPEADTYGRFQDGQPPAKNGDFAFLLHLLASMKSTGSGAIILPHGVLFRGNAEARLREKILKRGYIKGVIGLPANLFYGTGIPASIIVLDKAEAVADRPVFMIDASKGFIKDGNKNRLRERDIHRIIDAYTTQSDIPGYSRLVPADAIARNGFNLNIPRYIDGSDPEDLQDIEAHLKGGVPDRDLDALGDFWEVMPTLRATLFGPNKRVGYSDPLVAPDTVRTTIREHPEFSAFRDTVHGVLDGWRTANIAALRGIEQNDAPKSLINRLGEDMLARFASAPLVDRYEAYQRLMSYWAATMQDDVFIISGGGWDAAKDLREARKERDGKKVKWLEEADLTVDRVRLVADVIPPALIIARFFGAQQAALDAAQAKADDLTREIEEMVEEHGAEGGLLADALTDTGKLTAASVKARIKTGEADAEEKPMLARAAKVLAAEAAAKKVVKELDAVLTKDVLKKYPDLTGDEIRALVVEDKWLTDIAVVIEAEVEARTEQLTGRVCVLTECYGQTLGDLGAALAALEEKVTGHLERMGLGA